MVSHTHRTHRSGWLRAAVLGANDGVLSISSLMLGVAAADANPSALLLAGLAGLVAGALSMGAGEYVSVSSQADTERADLDTEQNALTDDYDAEHVELRDIYVARGLDHNLAHQVSHQLMAHDALAAHARDDIGISDALTARPLQAAIASSISFALGAMVPYLAGGSLVSLALLGARAGGAPIVRGAVRVLIWGALAMGITVAVGAPFGAAT